MKKILALLLAALMVGSMMTGCTKQEATSGEESAQTQQTESEAKEEPVEEETQAAFTGAYIADPEYIKSKIGSEDVIFIDARGADAAKKRYHRGCNCNCMAAACPLCRRSFRR